MQTGMPSMQEMNKKVTTRRMRVGTGEGQGVLVMKFSS
jgi:hypothetical protein